MAQGTVGIFNEFLETIGKSEINLDTDTIKLALVTDVTTPTASTADPRWGAGGTTNFNTNEVTAGGNYTAEGDDILSTYSQAGGTATFDGTNIEWLVDGSNPTNARWGILYSDTDSDKKCIGWVDLGEVFNMTTGDLNVNWNASGIFTLS
jgi:hypothetical protein